MSSYFYPDEVMQMLAGLMQYHSAIMHNVPTHDQVDESRYDKAVGEVVQAQQPADAKTLVATAFRDNKLDVIPKARAYHVQSVDVRVGYTAMPMRAKFNRETVRIVQPPIISVFANNNIGGRSDMPKLHDAFAESKIKTVPVADLPETNVRSLDEWRNKRLRQSA